MQPLAWNAPELPVMPWTRRRVLLSTRIDIGLIFLTNQSFMDADRIPIRVRDDRHLADGSVERFNDELCVVFPKISNSQVEILNFESDRRPVRRRFPFVLRH